MPLDPEQLSAYLHAGTVALPSPYPAAGAVSIVPQGPLDADGNPAFVFLKVVHTLSPALQLARVVSLADVRVFEFFGTAPQAPQAARGRHKARGEEAQAPTSPTPTAEDSTEWASSELTAFVQSVLKGITAISGEIPLHPKAILFVPEGAPVLTQVDVGLTAQESAEYYPPLPGVQLMAPCDCCMRHHPKKTYGFACDGGC